MCIRDRFHSDAVYLLGAPDILLASQPDAADTLRQVEEFSAKGCRVLLLGLYEGCLLYTSSSGRTARHRSFAAGLEAWSASSASTLSSSSFVSDF